MTRLKHLGVILLIAMNALFLLAQTETFPRYRLVGGNSGVPVEVSSSNQILTTLTGTAAQADTGLASTLPRFRLAGGTTGNLAEVDSSGHLLINFAETGLTSAQLAASLTNETGTAGSAVFSIGPTFGTSTNGFTTVALANANAGTSAGSYYTAGSDAADVYMGATSALYAGALGADLGFLFSDTTASGGLSISARAGGLRFYANGAETTPFVTVASTGIVTVAAVTSQNTDVVLPANSIGGGEVSGVRFDLIYCGQAAENGTIYLSPAAGINGVTIGARPELASVTCDALDGATEATQDIVIFPNNAFKVMGMYCMQSGAEPLAAGETIITHFRSAAANVTPDVTCTIAVGETGCASLVGTTTNIAAGAATAVQAIMASNNSDQDIWCSVSVMLQ